MKSSPGHAATLLAALLGGCGTDLLPTQSSPWIQASWQVTRTHTLGSDELGKIAVTSGGYLFGSAVAYANFLPDRTSHSSMTPRTVTLDEYGTGTTGITVSGAGCATKVGKELDSLTVVLVIQGVAKDTARLAMTCQAGIRP